MSIINDLTKAGNVVFHHDYRAGHSDDLSGNELVFTVTGPHVYTRIGRRVQSTTASHSDSTDNTLDFDATGTMSIAIVFKVVDAQGSADTLVRKSLWNNTGYYFIKTSAESISFVEDDASSGHATPTNSLNRGEIATAIVTYNNQTVKIYINGISQTLSTVGTPVWVSNTVSNYTINDGYSLDNYQGEFGAIVHFNKELSATEVSKVHAELINTVYPTKPVAKAKPENISESNRDDSSLVGSWDMKPVAGVVPDNSSNGNNMSKTGYPVHVTTPFGDGMDFLATDENYVIKTTFNNAPSTAITVSSWQKIHTLKDWNRVVSHTGWAAPGAWILLSDASGYMLFGVHDGAQKVANTGAGTIGADRWQHVVGTYDGTTVKVYVDGVIGSTTASSTGGLDTTLDVSISVAGANGMNGIVANTKIYNEAKDQAWVTKEYQKGSRAIQFKTDFGITETTADLTTGVIPGTDFDILSGTWKVETVDNEKILTCVAAGQVTMPVGVMGQSPTEASFGTWEFNLYKGGDANIFNIIFAADTWAIVDGYILQYFNDEKLYITEYTSGSPSSHEVGASLGFNTWHKIVITRSNASVFTVYVDDVETGTWTDASGIKTTTNIFGFDMDAGDKVVLSNLKGDKGIIKRVGVYV